MSYRINRRSGYHRKKQYPLLIALLTIIICAGLSLGIAAFWQNHSEKNIVSSPDPVTAEVPSSQQEASSLSSAEESEPEPEPEVSLPEPDLFDYSAAVPVSDRVTVSYFDDALFVGDSITAGIEAYALMKNAQVIAFTGINTDTILTREVIRNEAGELETMPEAIANCEGVSKIYVMLGANGIAWIGKEHFIENYGIFLDSIRQAHPEADIYVQSILPVTAEKEAEDEKFANAKIRSYNAALQDMAEENNYYYLNVAEAFADENGCLPEAASPTDGMHFGPKYYELWFDYLKIHVANPDEIDRYRLNSALSSSSTASSLQTESSSQAAQ